MNRVHGHQDKLIKLQALFRGYHTRKHLKNLKEQAEAKVILSNHPRSNKIGGLAKFGAGYSAKEIYEMPDYSNQQTKATEERIGPFIYDQPEPSSDDLVQRAPFELDNGAIYYGQWTKEGHRQGKGIQIWKDGSKYEGYWHNDQAHGFGRMIHADGDYFQGNWLFDRSNGRGMYEHTDGAKYIGEWKDDKQHGYGVETWPDGARYEGNYEIGRKHGIGLFKWADGSTYIG